MSATQELLQRLVGEDRMESASSAPSPLRALAWARVSTKRQEERGLSLDEQRREIREYAKEHRIEILAEFHEAESAFQKEERRTEFHRMLTQAQSDPAVNAILVHDFSRFSRDSLRARSLVRELRRKGIEVISVTDIASDPDTVSGVYLEAITHAKNEAFSREVAFHTRKGCRGNMQTRDSETGWYYQNGGQPLWGYEIQHLVRGVDRRGKGIEKSIWVRDETIVAGKPLHEWVHHCLVELAGNGASLNELRDFCERTGLPARRVGHWGTSTWHALLQPYVLLKYCGVGLWNVHRKDGSIRPSDEWVVVENAHPAILTSDEARRIADARRAQTRPRHFMPAGRSRTSPYLLTGGLFKCARCGANMTGLKTTKGSYYVCGSMPYRRGRGCGPGVYVPVALVEAEAIRGLRELVGQTSDPAGFAKRVNDELARLWAAQTGQDPEAEKKLAAIDVKIGRVRHALEEGLQDVTWANERLGELNRERAAVQVQVQSALDGVQVQNANSRCPKVSVEQVMAMRRDVERLFEVEGATAQKKQLLRIWVQEMKLAPERREVELTYRVPEPVMNKVVAGAGFEPATFGL